MRIVSVELFVGAAGFRDSRYIKLTTDEGIIGWAEYVAGAPAAVAALIVEYVDYLKQTGANPAHAGAISVNLTAATKHFHGGIAQQAIAAIENACLDIQGKAAGIPVYEILGGPVRTEIPLYWTHCGSFRVRYHEFYENVVGTPPIRTLDDLVTLGQEARAVGFTTVKTNPISFAGAMPKMFNGGFTAGPESYGQTLRPQVVEEIADQIAALQKGLGDDGQVMLDIAFSQNPSGARELGRKLKDSGLRWLEFDNPDAAAVAAIRDDGYVRIGSGETLYGLSQYRPFIERGAMDVCIVDVFYNGVYQTARIAHLAAAYETHIAPHNPRGLLGTLQSAHLSAAIPNFDILEYRHDAAPWIHEFLTNPPTIADGTLHLTSAPGWGSDIDEESLARYSSHGGG